MKSFPQVQKALRSHNLSKISSSFPRSKAGPSVHLRFYHEDGRRRVSAFWIPSGGIAKTMGEEKEDSHSLLIRAGFIRQAHAGLFQFLPLGLRVQEKIERLVDKHMSKLGGSKLSLSTFSSEDLWQKTGRLDRSSSELFRLMDRKGGKYLLSPTHEEEITSLVGSIVKSYKELPLRLYQISRKYRDEPRPRQGLLRTREFLMKDLYTFDSTPKEALETYKCVRQAYDTFFNEFKIPFLTAEAASGEMGGDLSHEYHFRTTKGEDNIISCTSCGYVANEELAQSGQNLSNSAHESKNEGPSSTRQVKNVDYTLHPPKDLETQAKYSNQWLGVTQNRSTIVQAFLPSEIEAQTTDGKQTRNTNINVHAIKGLFPELDLSVENPIEAFKQHWRLQQLVETGIAGLSEIPRILRIFDIRYSNILPSPDSITIDGLEVPVLHEHCKLTGAIDLVKIQRGDPCPRCDEGTLKVEPAVELGHTFHLGTRYSAPLNATIATKESQNEQTPMQMGCHGIGVSRLIAAVADSLADSKGLNWPRVMAPFEAVVLSGGDHEGDAVEVYDALAATSDSPIDAILDDRNKQLGWKIRDADLIGYPVIVVVGRDWKKGRKVEVQCRRLDSKELVPVGNLRAYVEGKLQQL